MKSASRKFVEGGTGNKQHHQSNPTRSIWITNPNDATSFLKNRNNNAENFYWVPSRANRNIFVGQELWVKAKISRNEEFVHVLNLPKLSSKVLELSLERMGSKPGWRFFNSQNEVIRLADDKIEIGCGKYVTMVIILFISKNIIIIGGKSGSWKFRKNLKSQKTGLKQLRSHKRAFKCSLTHRKWTLNDKVTI